MSHPPRPGLAPARWPTRPGAFARIESARASLERGTDDLVGLHHLEMGRAWFELGVPDRARRHLRRAVADDTPGRIRGDAADWARALTVRVSLAAARDGEERRRLARESYDELSDGEPARWCALYGRLQTVDEVTVADRGSSVLSELRLATAGAGPELRLVACRLLRASARGARSDPAVVTFVAQVYDRLGRCEAPDRLLADVPIGIEARYQLALALFEAGRYREADDHLAALVGTPPGRRRVAAMLTRARADRARELERRMRARRVSR